MSVYDAYQTFFTEYPDVVDIEQMCEMLGGIGKKSAYKLLKNGMIKSLRIGKKYRIPKKYIIEYLGVLEE